MFSKILCAIDGSSQSLEAARLAAGLASRFESDLIFISVTKRIELTDDVKRYMELEHLSDEPQYILDQEARKGLDEAMAIARQAGVEKAETIVDTGAPARTIVSYSNNTDVDCIVLGSRGLGEIQSTLLGSVSHKVSSLADCTVVIARS